MHPLAIILIILTAADYFYTDFLTSRYSHLRERSYLNRKLGLGPTTLLRIFLIAIIDRFSEIPAAVMVLWLLTALTTMALLQNYLTHRKQRRRSQLLGDSQP